MPQCQKMTRESLGTERCKNPAAEGSKYCNRCGRRRKRRRLISSVKSSRATGQLPSMYRQVLSGNLRDAIDTYMAEKTPQEQLQIFEELALMRHAATQSVALYNAACNMDAPDEETSQKKQRHILACAEMMKESLTAVANLAKQAAAIESSSKDQMSLAQIGVIIDQLVQVAYDVFKDADQRLVARFAEEVRTRVKVPTLETQGTLITPDQDVLLMDSTIPNAPTDGDVEDDDVEDDEN